MHAPPNSKGKLNNLIYLIEKIIYDASTYFNFIP